MTIETEGSPFGAAGDEFDASDAFFKHIEESDKRTSEGAQDPVETVEKTAATETPAEPVEGTVESPESDDDVEVELPFGKETKKFALKDVRAALEAREKAVTAPAEHPQAAQVERASAALGKLVEKARARYAPYANIDWLALSRDPQITHDDFVALREDAGAALTDLQFLTTELDGVTQQARQQSQQAHVAAQKACVEALTNPETGIKGFGPQLYEQLMQFATAQGMPEMRQSTQAPALKLLHLAMLAHQGQQKTEAQVRKVVEQPKRVIKPGGNKQGGGNDRAAALKNLREVGSSDAVTAAFLADIHK